MKSAIIKEFILIIILYFFGVYKFGADLVNAKIFNTISYDPLLIIILFFAGAVFWLPSEIKIAAINWVYCSALLLICLAVILYSIGIHGYNTKLAIDGGALFLTGISLTLTSGAAWSQSFSRDDKSIKKSIQLGAGVCPNCLKKISRFASKCPYCTSDL